MGGAQDFPSYSPQILESKRIHKTMLVVGWEISSPTNELFWRRESLSVTQAPIRGTSCHIDPTGQFTWCRGVRSCILSPGVA